MIPILESMLLVGLCSVIASVLAIVPVVVGRSLSESFTLWVPKDWVILWCAGLGLLIVLSPLAGLRAIRARERTADALI
jgi:putative ABC transport system permease protein